MQLLRVLEYIGEAIPAALALLIVPWLPRPAVVRLARGLGAAAYRLAPRLRRIALANVEVAFRAELDAARRAEIVRGSFQSFALLALDLAWFSLFNRRRVARHVRFDASFEPYFRTAPIIGVTGHFGNWEIMGQAVAARGAPCLSVAAQFDNPLLTKFLNAVRARGGLHVTPQKGAVRHVMQALRRKQRVAVLVDQNILPYQGGVFVPFFGLLVPMSRVVYHLCTRAKSVAIYTYCLPDTRGDYTVYGLPPFDASEPGLTDAEMAARIARMSETPIREHPEHWLWMYRRWKWVPEGTEMKGYPYYARRVPAAFAVARESDGVAQAQGKGPTAEGARI